MFGKKKKIEIIAPVDCKVIKLEDIKDEVFSQKMLGDGFGIEPTKGNFVAPITGKLVTVFKPSGHAYGFQFKDKTEILMHIGLDTVNLKGDGFEILVDQDQMIKAGDKLVNIDLKSIEDKKISTQTPIIVTSNTLNNKKINILKFGNVKQGEIIAEVI